MINWVRTHSLETGAGTWLQEALTIHALEPLLSVQYPDHDPFFSRWLQGSRTEAHWAVTVATHWSLTDRITRAIKMLNKMDNSKADQHARLRPESLLCCQICRMVGGKWRQSTRTVGKERSKHEAWTQKPLLLRTKKSSLMAQKEKIHNAANQQTEGYTNSRRNYCRSVLRIC